MLPEKMKFSQCGQWLANNDHNWFSKELTSITIHWWQFLIKEAINDNIKS